ncbi:MAG TPA: hypothetical protein PLV42_03640 [bacterium]|nr:hypothetical protein [bacterium]
MVVWQSAENSFQKKAILDHLLPTTHDEYVDALVAFAEDEDENIRSVAFDRLKTVEIADLNKRADAAATRRTIRALVRYCVTNPHPGLIARLLNSKRLPWSFVKQYWMTPQEDLWRTLVANKNFILFSHPDRDPIAAFIHAFNHAIADSYREQIKWVTPKELAAFIRPAEEDEGEKMTVTALDAMQAFDIEGVEVGEEELVMPGMEMDVSGALFDTGQGVVAEENEVVDLDSVELDVPDFLLIENPFEGLSREEMERERRKIADIIKDLTMGQRLKLATVGNLEARKILIKDPRRLVAMAVLGNGGITPGEVAALAINPATFQDVIEHIANNRNLSKSYMVKFALVQNPKTPIKIAMRLLEIVRRADLKKVADNKGISPIIKNMAKKRMR